MSLPIDKIMDLHEVYFFSLKQCERIVHLTNTRVYARGPNLGRNKQFVIDVEFCREVADNALRSSIHRGTVDNGTTIFNERFQNVLPWGALRAGCIHVKRPPRSQPDGRYLFAG